MKRACFLIMLFAPPAGMAAGDATVDLLSGYRLWPHMKTMIIQPGHPLEGPFGGIHHIYANAKAMAGLSSGSYADGAMFVFDLLDYQTQDNTIVETHRKRLDVMRYERDGFSTTGGWDFASFLPDSQETRVTQDVKKACFACHVAAKASEFVFSEFRP